MSRNDQVFEFIQQYFRQHHQSPRLADIMAGMNMPTLSCVHYHVHRLQKRGLIRITYAAPRGISIVRPESTRQLLITADGERSQHWIEDVLQAAGRLASKHKVRIMETSTQ